MNGHKKQKEQSRQMIEDALFELLDEKEFSKITVSEIVTRADVARRTFYRTYENKESVIHNYFQRLCYQYQSTYQSMKSYDLRQIANDYFSFWYKEKEILLKLRKSGLDDILYYEISSASKAVIGKRVDDENLRQSSDMEYFAAFSVGGFINLLFRWIDSGMEETPMDYAKIVSESIMKFLYKEI